MIQWILSIWNGCQISFLTGIFFFVQMAAMLHFTMTN